MGDRVAGSGCAPTSLSKRSLAKLPFGIALSAALAVGAQASLGLGADLPRHQGTVAKKIAAFRESFVVGGMDFNADGTQLAVSEESIGPRVHIWAWRRPSRISRELDVSVPPSDNAISYSPNGTLLAVGHMREAPQLGAGLIRIWDTATGAVVHSIAEPQGATAIMGLAFSPDGRLLVRTVQRGAPAFLVVHETDNWDEVWSLPTPLFSPRVLALSPDGSFAAIGGEALVKGEGAIYHPEILIVDLKGRQLARTIRSAFVDQNEIHALDWSPDGKTIAAGVIVQGSYPGPDAVKLFEATTGLELSNESAKIAYVNGLRYSHDGRYLAEGYLDGHVRIWDGQHQKLLQSIPVDDHFNTVLSVSRDSRHLAIGAGKDVAIWELE